MDRDLSYFSLYKKFSLNINNILGVNKIDKIGIAVSGGSDSIALLHLLIEWSRAKNIEVTIFFC